jgi:hypothetical protein
MLDRGIKLFLRISFVFVEGFVPLLFIERW